MSNIKLKKILEENFSGTVLGGVVSKSPWHDNISLTKIVKEKYGETEETEVDIKTLTTEISNYQKLSKQIFGESNITQIAEKLSWIATQAKSHSLQETDDWFDKITVNRNMKELTGLSKQFSSIANESKSLQERMGALYEDMGHILGRYYQVGENQNSEIKEGEYEAFFQSAMKKFGISSPDELDDDKKKEFFNYVDKNYKADNETD
tara:strand:- start:250 stop:870 length:621 start_codon:yes stop_codon:yes gene_type:complete